MQSTRSRIRQAAFVIASLLALAGCSMHPTAPGAPAGQSSTPSAVPDVAAGSTAVSLVASKAIDGRVGGVLSVGRWKVIVPDGAFSGTGTITITVPDTSVDKCDLSIAPSSLNRFSEPVELRFLCASMKEADARDMRWWDPVNKSWVVIRSWPESSDVSLCAPLKHFSTYASGKAGW